MPELNPAQFRFSVLSSLIDDIDVWCGTKPPRPWPPKKNGLRDVLISVAIHTPAEQISDAKLREQLQGVAATAFANGGKSLA